jgi:hypothetical protein
MDDADWEDACWDEYDEYPGEPVTDAPSDADTADANDGPTEDAVAEQSADEVEATDEESGDDDSTVLEKAIRNYYGEDEPIEGYDSAEADTK